MSAHDLRSARRPDPDQEMVDVADYVLDGTIDSTEAYDTARYVLLDSLATAMMAMRFPECVKHLGPVVPGAVIRCRPVGALLMEDEAGKDEKVLAVPVDALHPFYTGVSSYRDLPAVMLEQIGHFFQHYKDLEKGKWVTIVRWVDTADAEHIIQEGIARAQGR